MIKEELRKCAECGESYDPSAGDAMYYSHPYGYDKGCETHCLACWLGVGPIDIEKMNNESSAS
jgi:hypothetical protein